MRFEFAAAGRILFGAGAAADVPAIAAGLGRRAFVVTGRHPARVGALLEDIRAAVDAIDVWPTAGEPTIASVMDGVARARAAGADLVVAIGGGSAIDAGKAVAALAANPGDILDYLEVVGRARPLTMTPLPFVAVPTTAGTGAEATRNAVIGVPEQRVKVSLRSALMLPRVAVVDPDLTHGVPPDVTAATGLDALTQLIEAFVSTRANPFTDALCRDGIPRAARALPAAWRDGADAAARADMALASLSSGIALANAGLGAVHGFAGPIGGRAGAPHGAICAALLPHVCAANLAALEADAPQHAAMARYRTVATLLTGRPEATAAEGVVWLRDLARDLRVPPLGTYGVGVSDVDDLVEQAMRASSMKANPIALPAARLRAVLHAAI
jgi:alcohol dehydrogenase class IV